MRSASLPTASNGLVTLSGAAAGEWLEHANEAVREAAYRVHYGDAASTGGGAADQERALVELFSHRHRLASLAGFSSFAERSVRATMAESRGAPRRQPSDHHLLLSVSFGKRYCVPLCTSAFTS